MKNKENNEEEHFNSNTRIVLKQYKFIGFIPSVLDNTSYTKTIEALIIFSLNGMSVLTLLILFTLVFYYDYSLYPSVSRVIASSSLFLLAPFLIRSVYPPKRINYWKANQYAYTSFHGSLPDDEITQCNDICGSVIPFHVYLIPSAQGAWSVVMECTIRFSPSDSL